MSESCGRVLLKRSDIRTLQGFASGLFFRCLHEVNHRKNKNKPPAKVFQYWYDGFLKKVSRNCWKLLSFGRPLPAQSLQLRHRDHSNARKHLTDTVTHTTMQFSSTFFWGCDLSPPWHQLHELLASIKRRHGRASPTSSPIRNSLEGVARARACARSSKGFQALTAPEIPKSNPQAAHRGAQLLSSPMKASQRICSKEWID